MCYSEGMGGPGEAAGGGNAVATCGWGCGGPPSLFPPSLLHPLPSPHSLHQSHIHPGNATTSLLPPLPSSISYPTPTCASTHSRTHSTRSLPPCVATDGPQQHALSHTQHTNARTRIQAFRKPRGLRNTSTGRSGFASVPRLVNTLEVSLKVTPGESDVIRITFVNSDFTREHE